MQRATVGQSFARTKARVATAGAAGQQGLFANVVELLKLRQDDFVAIPIDGEDLHRTADKAQSPVSPSRKISAEAGTCTTWLTLARARSSPASRSLNRAKRRRSCSRPGSIMIRSEYKKHYRLITIVNGNHGIICTAASVPTAHQSC